MKTVKDFLSVLEDRETQYMRDLYDYMDRKDPGSTSHDPCVCASEAKALDDRRVEIQKNKKVLAMYLTK